ALVDVPEPAVRLVATVLQGRVDDAAAGPPVLGVVGVGLDLELLHCIRGGREVVATARAVGSPVQEELVGGQAAAVERPGGAALVVEGAEARGARGPEGRDLPVHASRQ